MKKGLILGLSIALAGSALAVGGAAALYIKNADEVSINIGARTDTDLTYTVTGVAWNGTSGYTDFQPGKTNTLGFALGATKPAKSTYIQDTMVGKLTIEISSTNTDFISYFDDKITATVAYDDNTFYTKDSRNTVTLKKDEETGKLVGTKEFPALLTGQNVSMPLALPSDISQEDMLKLAGASYSVDITWDKTTTFEYAYVQGSFNNWTDTDAYQMVPMLNTADFEWKCATTATTKAAMVKDAKLRCRVGSTWSGSGDTTISEAQGGKINCVYWKGGTNEPTFSLDE